MRTPKNDHALARLERAADRVHLSTFASASTTQRTKARLSSALNHCIEAASDLERLLGRAAADARDPFLHRELYGLAQNVGALTPALENALVSLGAFVERGGTARGALHRVLLEGRIAMRGRTDAIVLAETEAAVLRAFAVYDAAIAAISCAPGAFVDLLVQQRKTLSRVHRAIARRTSPLEVTP